MLGGRASCFDTSFRAVSDFKYKLSTKAPVFKWTQKGPEPKDSPIRTEEPENITAWVVLGLQRLTLSWTLLGPFRTKSHALGNKMGNMGWPKKRARPMSLGSQKNSGPFGGPKRPRKAKETQRPDLRKDRAQNMHSSQDKSRA